MHYQRKYDLETNYVANADTLMEEMYGAVEGLNALDQNNFANNVVAPDVPMASSASPLALTVGNLTPTTTISQRVGNLAPIKDTWVTSSFMSLASPGFVTFTTTGVLRAKIIGRGQYREALVAPALPFMQVFDVRLVIDGAPGKVVHTASLDAEAPAPAEVRIGWSIIEEVLLPAGTHNVGLQVRDRSESMGVFRDHATGTNNTGWVGVIGFRR
tara:strand:+ start:17211 stop:17852 length:642 start_codon:yes stop_codon:yes gene_type:complete